MKLEIGINDLATTHPHLVDEWDFESNGDRQPNQFTAGSRQPINWKCKAHGHRWPAIIASRTHGGSNCPFCSNRKVLKGFNDLETLHPELAKEWDFENNEEKTPDQFTPGSRQPINWVCGLGHRWSAKIKDRVGKNSGCPYCSNKKLLKGFNDFETLHPELALDWDYEKNEKGPDQYINGSGAKVHWKCHQCGYRWPAKIADRVNCDSGCPGCDNRVPIPGVNDVATIYPHLILDWDFEHNEGKRPEQFTKNSGEMINWKCSICGHSWSATIHNRTSHDSGCPNCANKALIPGVNDLATTHPYLIEEWDYDSNQENLPEHFRKGSMEKVNWICKVCEHRWMASINDRTSGTGCPKCAGKLVITGENDFASQRPHLLEDWDYSKNDHQPTEVFTHSSTPTHWKCHVCGHEWMAPIASRSNGSGCPKCTGKLLIVGENDFASQRPHLLEDWDYSKNDHQPTEVFTHSSTPTHWKCHVCGHEWMAPIASRSNGSGCPKCSGRKSARRKVI